MQANTILKDEKLSQLLDSRLGGDYDHEQIERLVLAATLCIRREPQTRPRIGNVSHLPSGCDSLYMFDVVISYAY